MRFLSVFTLLAATIVSTVSAQASLATIPSCALGCMVEHIPKSACAPTNQTCICTNTDLQAALEGCVKSSCTVRESLVTKNFSQTNCKVPVRDRGQEHAVLIIVTSTVNITIVLFRLWHRLFVLKMPLGADDWCIAFVAVSSIASTVLAVRGTIANGLGRDVWTLTPDQITTYAKCFYFMAILYFMQVNMIKMSLLFFYLRIFPERKVRQTIWVTIGANAIFGLIYLFLPIFQCNPIHYYWTKWDHEHQGTCLDINNITWANAGISIAFDIWMLSIPLAQLRHLQMHWKKKVGVGIMFVVGTFFTIVSIIRLPALVTLTSSNNTTWDNYDTSTWSTIEIHAGMLCVCLPSIRQILVMLFPILGGSTARSNGYSYGNNSRSKGFKTPKSGGFSAVVSGQHSLTDNEPVTKPSGGIVMQRTYEVKHSENDEESLVHMQDLKASKGTSSAASNKSSLSLELPDRSYAKYTGRNFKNA